MKATASMLGRGLFHPNLGDKLMDDGNLRPLPGLFVVMGRDRIDITPRMVEAGFAVLCNSGIADDYLVADKLVVVEIFEAMVRSTKPRDEEWAVR